MQPDTLISLSYVSKATHDMGMLSLMRLVDQAVNLNKEIGATGVLFYENQCFGQTLEGRYSEIMALWAKIQKDPRHNQVRLMGIEEIKDRQFPDWSMRFVGADEIAKKVPNLRKILNALPEHDDALLNAMRISSTLPL